MRRAALAPRSGAPSLRPFSPLFLLLPLLLPDQKGGSASVAAQGEFSYQDLCRYTWEAVDPDKVHYRINFCGNAGDCGASSAICAYDLKTASHFSVVYFVPVQGETGCDKSGCERNPGIFLKQRMKSLWQLSSFSHLMNPGSSSL
ncbi:cation-independent mannose-6-phosphate receptor-like [Varanus komodoensis]|uniref:cation-independent mannose-6-phosphate receptor-like n=1 Tax=Varanus komodoensis TaxID=61221 RepID=UPI001CF774D9|nr:cation-independent mannose-6-phosphate receptor-like [Varanus komodoensis]